MLEQTAKIEETVVESNTAPAPEVETTVATFDFVGKFNEFNKAKSPMIRFMASLPEFQKSNGLPDIGKINKAFEAAGVKMIYQHVRNVLNTPLKTK